MRQKFKNGEHVTWNSEAGHVSGTIVKIHIRNFGYKGYTHHASKEDPQYEIKSNKTDILLYIKPVHFQKTRKLN